MKTYQFHFEPSGKCLHRIMDELLETIRQDAEKRDAQMSNDETLKRHFDFAFIITVSGDSAEILEILYAFNLSAATTIYSYTYGDYIEHLAPDDDIPGIKQNNCKLCDLNGLCFIAKRINILLVDKPPDTMVYSLLDLRDIMSGHS
jgi:hypothetical protein